MLKNTLLRLNLKSVFGGVSSVFLALVLSGCQTFMGSSGSKSQFRSSAINDGNQVPQWMAPPEVANQHSKIDPLNMRMQADYHFALAETYSLAGNYQKAVEELRLTLIYDPNSAVVRTRLAQEFFRLNMFNEAIEQCKHAKEADPKYVEARSLLARIYTVLKMFDFAIQEYEEVVKIAPKDFDSQLFIGAILAERGKFNEAVSHFKKLTQNKEFKRLDLAYFYLGRVYVEKKKGNPKANKKLAINAFEKALEADAKFEDALTALVKIHIDSKNDKKAERLLLDYQNANGPTFKVASLLVQIYMAREDFDRALVQYEILSSHQPYDLNIRFKMALILMDQKKYDKAILTLEQILAQEPRADKVRFYLAAVNEELKRNDEAIAHFMKVPATSQYYGDSIVHATFLYKNRGDFTMAKKTIESGLKVRENIPEFYTLYASLLDETKEYKKALVVLKEALAKFPKNVQVAFYKGSVHDKVGETDETIESMQYVLELDPNHVQALNYLAYTFAEKDVNLAKAEKLVRKALDLTPNDGYIMDTLGWVLFKSGKVKDAVSVLEKAYGLKSTESIIAEHLGDAYNKYQLPQKAKEMYLKAVEIETNKENIRKLQQKISAIENQKKTGREPASSSAANP